MKKLTLLLAISLFIIASSQAQWTGSRYEFGSNGTNPGNATAALYDQGFVGPTINGLNISFRTGGSGANSERVRITSSGKVGIGTANPTDLLTVNGKITAEEIEVKSVGADYVFSAGYNLRPLKEVESFIKENHHLPDIAPAAETENGVELGAFTESLLAKIEELTLYTIDQEKEIQELRESLEIMMKRLDQIESSK